MCEVFISADPESYASRTRSVRLHGVVTSIRLENMVWDLLAEMAEDEGCTTNALIAQFHDEILAHRGEVPNFASFLRVTCMRYLRRRMLELERQQTEEALPTLQARVSALRPVVRSASLEGVRLFSGQSDRQREDHWPMHQAFTELGRLGIDAVHVQGVEVTGEAGPVDDVRLGHGDRRRTVLVADLEVVAVLARCHAPPPDALATG